MFDDPQTLDDFPFILPELTLMATHGLGNGGGERVAREIRDIYLEAGKSVKIVASQDLDWHAELRSIHRPSHSSPVLFTAGPRDIPRMLTCVTLGVRFSVYIQVPYMRAITLRDPVHMAAVIAYWLIVCIFAAKILVNSSTTWRVPRPTLIVHPIRLSSASCHCPATTNPSSRAAGRRRIVTAFRLSQERGRGSKDIRALRRLCAYIQGLNLRSNFTEQFEIHHYGDNSVSLVREFSEVVDVIHFHGFVENWLAECQADAFVFFSNYEGFGLAAFEAMKTGVPVFVNEAFPRDIIQYGNAVRVNGRDPSAIIDQMKRYWNE